MRSPSSTIEDAELATGIGAMVSGAGVIAVFYLLREHWGHLLGVWPYLLLMLCPLMHLLHGHGQHRDHREHDHSHDRR